MADQILQFGQIEELGPQFLVERGVRGLSTRSFSGGMVASSLSIDGLDGGAFSFLLRHLPFDGGDLRILFGGLADQEAAMHLDQVG